MLFSGLVTSCLGNRIPHPGASESRVMPCLSSHSAPPHSAPALCFHSKMSAWLPLVRDLNHLSSFPTTRSCCWLCSASQFHKVCSHQMLAGRGSSRELPKYQLPGISPFHRVWPLERYTLGMCNSSFSAAMSSQSYEFSIMPLAFVWGQYEKWAHEEYTALFPIAIGGVGAGGWGWGGPIQYSGQRPTRDTWESPLSWVLSWEGFFWWKSLLLFIK